MLVLSRTIGECIILRTSDGLIELRVEDIRCPSKDRMDRKVRLSFDAPDEVLIDRQEIFDSKEAESNGDHT